MIAAIRDLIVDKISGEWGEEAMPGEGVRVIRTANFTNLGVIKFNNIVFREIDPKKINQKKLRKGDIIIEKSGGGPTQPVGRVVFFDYEGDEIFLCNNFTAILRPNREKVYPKFLFYQLYIGHVRGKTLKYQNKTTGIINLKLDRYLEETIIVPSINDQIKIATVLSKAETLIQQRKDSLRILDSFSKNIFIKMFGNPLENEKGWDVLPLDELVAEDCPLTYGIVQPGNDYANGTPVVRPVDLTQDKIYRKGLKLIDPTISVKYKRTVLRGDEILMCVRGSTGVVSLATPELKGCNVTRGIAPIWFKPEFNKLFGFFLFKSGAFQNAIFDKTYGATLQQINLSDLRKLKTINPPTDLQNKFGLIMEKVQFLRDYYENTLIELENLYSGISQQAFNGQLQLDNLSVIVPEEYSSTDNDRTDPSHFNKPLDYTNIDIRLKDTRIGDPFDVDEETARAQGEEFYTLWRQVHDKRIEQENFQRALDFATRPKKKKGNKGINLILAGADPERSSEGKNVEHFEWAGDQSKEKPKSTIVWDSVSFQMAARWVKEKYMGYHFTFEMLTRFMMEEHVTFPHYFSSEELRKNPPLNNSKNDIKSFVFLALSDDGPKDFLKLKQEFFDAEKENLQLNLHEGDYQLIRDRSLSERSGIYFSIVE